jgi:arylsulfatase A-like enzyme
MLRQAVCNSMCSARHALNTGRYPVLSGPMDYCHSPNAQPFISIAMPPESLEMRENRYKDKLYRRIRFFFIP